MAKNILNPRGIKKQVAEAKKRNMNPEKPSPIERPTKRLRHHSPQKPPEDQKQFREDEVRPSHPSLEPLAKRVSVSTTLIPQTIREARIEFWQERGTWPTEGEEKMMDCFRDIFNHPRAEKDSLSRKLSNASLTTETPQTQIQSQSSQQPRDQKSAPYSHPMFEERLKECGSFMDDYSEGITAESEKLLQMLLQAPQSVPEHTLFSDNELFKKTVSRIRGENKTKVVRDIAQLIVPSAEILADRGGADHLKILRETTNACWVSSYTFINLSSSLSGPRPQPDFGLGFKRDAFSRNQLQKLQTCIGDPLVDCSWIAATYNMYLPFLSSEVECGGAGLDTADRQNAHTQSIILRGLYTVFRLVGRENELHRQINGFSISHNDVEVRIWGHYAIINEKDVEFYRHQIAGFGISPTARGDDRWTAYKFVKNVYDLWVPEHYKRICSVIDMLPADVNFNISELDQELSSSGSGMSQRFDDYSLADEQFASGSQSSFQQITPATTIQIKSSNTKQK